MAYPITKFGFYSLSRIMVNSVKGIENIPINSNFILISNHEKLIDPLYIICPILKKLNKKIHFLASARWWFLGETVCRKWAGCIPLFNSKQVYKEAKELVKSGEIVGIFPEGHLDSEIRNPKTGAVRLAIETNIPILPIGLKSSYLPFCSTLNIGKLVYIPNRKNIEKQTSDLMKQIYRLRDES